MMRTLTKSFLLEWGKTGLLALALVLSVLLAIQINRLGEIIFQTGLGSWAIMKAMFWLLPSFLVVCLPVAVFAALLAVFGRLNRDGERLAMRSAGLSELRFATIVLPVCLAVSAAVLFLSHFAAPHALNRLGALIEEEAETALVGRIRANSWVDLGKGSALFVRKVERDGSWSGPFLVRESGEERQVLWASGGRLEKSGNNLRLLFKDGGFEQFLKDRESTVSFERLSIALGDFTAAGERKAPFLYWQALDSRLLSAEISSCDGEHENCARLAGEIAHRTTAALAILVFGVLGLILSRKRILERLPAAYALTAVSVLGYYLLERFGMALGEKGVWPPALGPWLPLIVFALSISGFMILSRRAIS